MSGVTARDCRRHYCKAPTTKSWAVRDGDVLLFVCLFVRLSVASAAGPVRPVPDILMAVGAYRVGHCRGADLLKRRLKTYQYTVS